MFPSLIEPPLRVGGGVELVFKFKCYSGNIVNMLGCQNQDDLLEA